MPIDIQRQPLGFPNLLSSFGGQAPKELEDRVRASLEMAQYFGAPRQDSVTNAALAENGQLGFTVPANEWWLVRACGFLVVRTATMNALGVGIFTQVGPSSCLVASFNQQWTAGAAFASAGFNPELAWVPGYPFLLPPRCVLFAQLGTLGTDANCNALFQIDVRVLG